MGFNLSRLKEVAKQASEKEREEAKFRAENRDWMLKSALIALEIHRYLRQNGMTQSQLAEKLGISPAMVTKLLSGKENLSLKTICGIERVIQFELLKIPSYEKGAYIKLDLPKMPDENLEFEDGGQNFCKVVNLNEEVEIKKKVVAG
jgi:transcriptional regulator with XRE-family HTH domain